MAIVGCIVHTRTGMRDAVEGSLATLPGVTVHDRPEEVSLVVVVEALSDQLKDRMYTIKDLEGVLSVYTTFVTTEDEVDHAH